MFSVLIIGAGNIGAFMDNPGDDAVLSHAHAFSRHHGFTLCGFLDAEFDQADHAARVWGGNAYRSLDEAFKEKVVDLAVVAAPDESHCQILHELSEYSVGMVLCEKPLVKNLVEGHKIVSLYKNRQRPLAVNYSRRFVPEFVELRGDISTGKFGRFLSGTGYYGKGLLHNGSHMIDLLRCLLGEIRKAKRLNCIDDYYPVDPSVTALLEMENGGAFTLQAIDCRAFSIFEVDLLFERKRLRITDSGATLELFDVAPHPLFTGYQSMVSNSLVKTGYEQASLHLADNLYSFLADGKALNCTAADGLRALEICEEIRGQSE